MASLPHYLQSETETIVDPLVVIPKENQGKFNGLYNLNSALLVDKFVTERGLPSKLFVCRTRVGK